MTQNTIQKRDTVAQMMGRLNVDAHDLRSQNGAALGRSTINGREGANAAAVKGKNFAGVLGAAVKNNAASAKQTPQKADQFIEYTVQPGDTLWALGVKQFHVNLRDLIQDNGLVDPDRLQVGQKLAIRQTAPQSPSEVVASWYGEDYHGRAMANGDPYDMYANTIAHKDLPLGTKVELRNPRTGQTALAVVTDRGPFVAGRDVDLSYGLADKLSLVEKGVDSLVMKVL